MSNIAKHVAGSWRFGWFIGFLSKNFSNLTFTYTTLYTSNTRSPLKDMDMQRCKFNQPYIRPTQSHLYADSLAINIRNVMDVLTGPPLPTQPEFASVRVMAIPIQNPVKKIREDLGLTQRDAASICGVTEQVILKSEQGLYPTLGPSVLTNMAHVSSLSVGIIEAMYEDWINQELRTVKLPNTDEWRSVGTFPKWRYETCIMNGVADSVNAVCKLLKINPYVIQKYEAGRMKTTPLQLEERIAYIRGEF